MILTLGERRLFPDLLADRNAGNLELVPTPVIGLHEDANDVATCLVRQLSRSGPGAAFELVADHTCAAADIAFRQGACLGIGQGLPHMPILDMKAVAVVKITVPGFGDYRHRPRLHQLVVLHLPCYHGIANDSDTVRIGNAEGTFEEAGFLKPSGAGHLAVAVEG